MNGKREMKNSTINRRRWTFISFILHHSSFIVCLLPTAHSPLFTKLILHRSSFIVFISLFLLPAVARADYEQERKLGTFQARIRVETAANAGPDKTERVRVALSGFVLTIEVDGPAGYQVEIPTPAVTGEDWKISHTWPAETQKQPEGRERWQQRFRVEPAHDGDATLQVATFRINQSGKARRVAWQPIDLKVVTSIQKASLDQVRDNLSLEPLPGSGTANSRNVIWVTAGLLALGYLTIFGIRWHQRRLREETPARQAKRAIEQLVGEQGTDREHILKRYESLADLLRRYLEGRYALSAPARTTREFLEDLHKSNRLQPAQQELLEKFLSRSDLVKFAQAEPAAADWQEAAALAVRLVEETADEGK